jgi:hypothetical protein
LIRLWLIFELPDPHSGQDGCLNPYYLQRLLCFFQNNAELACKKPLKKAVKKERGSKLFRRARFNKWKVTSEEGL